MPSSKGMAGKMLREKKERGRKTSGVITVEQARGNNPAYRLHIVKVELIGPEIKEVRE